MLYQYSMFFLDSNSFSFISLILNVQKFEFRDGESKFIVKRDGGIVKKKEVFFLKEKNLQKSASLPAKKSVSPPWSHTESFQDMFY